jgi:parvulin-like peptidyl-prolyl isomerase
MKRVFFTVLFLAAEFSVVFAQNEAQTVALIELIKKEPITVRQFKAELAPLEQARGRPFSVAERRELLKELANQRLILQAAERDKIAVSENEVTEALRESLSQQNGRTLTNAEYAQAIQQLGANAAAVRQNVSKQLLMQKYLMSKKQAQINAVKPPTEEDILNWFNLNKASMVRPDTVCLTLISVPYGPDTASKAKAKEIADRLGRDIGGNAPKFDEAVLRGLVARTASGSSVPETGYVSTRGFYVSRTEETQQAVGKKFLEVAFSLNQGEVSPLIENDLAYQFIKVTEMLSQRALELTDPIDPASSLSVREYIRQGIGNQRYQEALDRALKELIDELQKPRNAITINDQYLNW